MSVHFNKRTGAYFVRYREDGKQVQKTFSGPDGKERACSFDQLISTKKKEEYEVKPKRTNQLYFDDLAQLWYDDKKNQGCSKWVDDFAIYLNNHVVDKLASTPLKDLTQSDFVKIISELTEDRSPTTRNRYLSYLKVMMNWAVEHGYLEVNPMAKWKKSKERPRQSTLTHEQLLKIRENAAPHLRDAIDLAYNTGLRTGESELLTLRWSHVDWENMSIRVFGSKTNRWRMIPLKLQYMERLKEMREKAKSNFIIEYRGKPIKSIKKSFKRACQLAGVEGVISYDIRHLFCTTLLSNNGDLASVSEMMGHSTVKMTVDQYYHLLDGHKRKTIDLLPELA